MREKCRRQGLAETSESALRHIRDAIGLRVVCTFPDDVYTIRDSLFFCGGAEIIAEKECMLNVKSNGYRNALQRCGP